MKPIKPIAWILFAFGLELALIIVLAAGCASRPKRFVVDIPPIPDVPMLVTNETAVLKPLPEVVQQPPVCICELVWRCQSNLLGKVKFNVERTTNLLQWIVVGATTNLYFWDTNSCRTAFYRVGVTNF